MDQIFTGRSRTTQLRAPTDRAKTRAEILAENRAKRAQRDEGQKQHQCAALIQRHYRGFHARGVAARRIIASTQDDVEPTLAWCSRVYGFFKLTTTPGSATAPMPARPRRGLWAWVSPLTLDCLETSVVRAVARSSPEVVRAANLSAPSIKAFADMLGRKVHPSTSIVSSLVIAAQSLPGTNSEADCVCRIALGVSSAAGVAGHRERAAVISRAVASVMFRVGTRCDFSDHSAALNGDVGAAVDIAGTLVQLPTLLGSGDGTFSGSAADTLLSAAEWRCEATAQSLSEAAAESICRESLTAFLRLIPHRVDSFEPQGAATLARRLIAMRESLPCTMEAMIGLGHHDILARSLTVVLRRVFQHRDTGAALFSELLAALRANPTGSLDPSAPGSPVSADVASGSDLAWLVGEGTSRLFASHGLRANEECEAANAPPGSAPVWQLLQELDSVCDMFSFPYRAYTSGAYRGAAAAVKGGPTGKSVAATFTTRRAHAVPYVSALAYNGSGFLVKGLWQVLSATTGTWALKDRAGSLVLRFPHVISLFANLCAVHLASGDLSEFASLVGGTDQLRRLVVVLRETVFLAVWNAPEVSPTPAAAPVPTTSSSKPAASEGINDASSPEQRRVTANFVAAAVQVLDAIYTADLNTRLIPAFEWIAPSITAPAPSEVTLQNLEGPEAAAAVAAITQGNPIANMSGADGGAAGGAAASSSDSDDLADVRQQHLLQGATARSQHAGMGMYRQHSGEARSGGGNSGTLIKLAALLRVAPFIVPFSARVVVFSRLLDEERMMQRSQGRAGLRVRRKHEFEDAFAELHETPRAIATVYDVRFKDDADREEMGYGQGVLRDFIHAAVEGGFRPENALFAEDAETKTLHILPYANPVPEEGDARPRFAFLGRLLGRAIQDGILVDVPLPGYLRNGLLGRQNGFADLLSYDTGLYRHLSALRAGQHSEEELEQMELTFTHSEQHLGQTFEVPLVAGGETLRVTRSNALQYCHLLTDYLLNRRCGRQVKALQQGLFEVVARDRLKLFNCEELQTLIRGQENDIPLDVDDWRAHTRYSRWDASNDAGVEVFWAAIRSMAPHEQRAVLKFATSAGRAPLLGFAQLQPPFTLERSGNDEAYLPTAATCMCALRVPRYSSPEVAKAKLLQAATQCDTFEMS